MSQSGGPDSAADSMVLRNSRADIDRAEMAIIHAMEAHAYGKAACFAVRLAVEEALSNAFHHGHKGLPADTHVTVDFSVDNQTVTVSIQDQGPGFDPTVVPDPTLDENLESPSGRGLLLIKAYMSKVEYNDKGNRVTMVFTQP